MDTRAETRTAEQSRRAKRREEFDVEVKPIYTKQEGLGKRTETVIEQIVALENGEAEFAKELAALRAASDAMDEATDRLARPDTGPVAVAAETEAIEHLLEARRAGSGGGGGGSTPGAGGPRTGTTNVSALALAGRGDAPNAHVEKKRVESSGGRETDDVPEELRSAMDRYFNTLEK